jgi:ABC-type multidrug transport system permease subunit
VPFILVAAIKDLRRRFADPAALVIWIGIPLLLGGLMNSITGDGGPTPRAHVLVVDEDDSTLSRLLLAAAGGGTGNPIDLESVTLDDGRRRIDAGDATALLVLPRGFQDAVINDTPAQLQLVSNPAERILPAIVETGLEIAVEGVFYLQRLFGPVLRQIAASPGAPSNAGVAAVSVQINEQIQRLQGVLLPPAIRLDVRVEQPAAGPALTFGQAFLPGILFMSFLFIAQGMSADIWREKMRGTLRRALTTPQAAWRLLAGKATAGALLMTAIALVGLLGGVALFDVAWIRVPLALAWCVFAGTSLIAFMTLLHTLASGQRGAEMLGSLVVFPFMMIGGSFFPFEAMPGWMAAIGQWTPNGLAVLRLKDLLFGTPALAEFAVGAAGIGLPAAAAFALAARRLRGRFATS